MTRNISITRKFLPSTLADRFANILAGKGNKQRGYNIFLQSFNIYRRKIRSDRLHHFDNKESHQGNFGVRAANEAPRTLPSQAPRSRADVARCFSVPFSIHHPATPGLDRIPDQARSGGLDREASSRKNPFLASKSLPKLLDQRTHNSLLELQAQHHAVVFEQHNMTRRVSGGMVKEAKCFPFQSTFSGLQPLSFSSGAAGSKVESVFNITCINFGRWKRIYERIPGSADLCAQIIQNVKPFVALQKVKKGGKTLSVPFGISRTRQEFIGVRFLAENAKKRESKLQPTLGLQQIMRSKFVSIVQRMHSRKTFSKMPGKALMGNKICFALAQEFSGVGITLERNPFHEENNLSRVRAVASQNNALPKKQGLFAHLPKQEKAKTPSLVRSEQQTSKGRAVLEESNLMHDTTISQSVKERNRTHQLALRNRAYMHYRWW